MSESEQNPPMEEEKATDAQRYIGGHFRTLGNLLEFEKKRRDVRKVRGKSSGMEQSKELLMKEGVLQNIVEQAVLPEKK